MMRRFISFGFVGLGIAVLVLAAVVRFAVAPAKAVLPGSTDTTRTYSGTAATLFNPAALGTGSSPLLKNVPITVTHHTKALGTTGNNALVSDAKVVTAAGKPVASVDYHYAVNRKNLGAGSGYTNVVRQSGVTFNWPIRTAQHNYVGWVSDTHATTTLTYTGTAKRGGVTTDVFTAATQPAPITDSQVLAALPSGLPKATLVQLATQLGLPSTVLGQLQAVLPTLPAVVPFHYTYQVEATYWVAPKSGIVVDLKQHEVRTLVLTIAGQNVPVTPVMDITFTSTPSSLSAAAHDAKDKAGAIDMIYVWLPAGLAIGGVVLALAGLTMLVVARRNQPPAAAGGSHERIDTVISPRS